MKPGLPIKAVGRSRFGGGLKQIAGVERNDSIIMDYSTET